MTTRNHTYRIPYERIMTIATRRGATINDAWLTGIYDGKPRIAISVTEDIAEPIEPVTLTIFADDERYAPDGSKRITTLYDGKGLYRLPTYQGMMARAAMGGVLADVDYRRGRGFDSRHLIYDPLDAAERKVRKQAEQIDTLRARVDQYAPVLADVERLARERKDTIDKHAKTIADQNRRLANQAKTIIADQATIDDLNVSLRIYQKAHRDAVEERDNLRAANHRQAGNRATIDRLRKQVEEQAETIGGLKTRNLALVVAARYAEKASGQPTAALLDSYQERGEIIAKQTRDLDRTKDLLTRWKAVAESRYKAAVAANQEITALTEQRDDAHDTIDSLRALVARQAKEHKRLNRHLNRIRSAATQLRHSVADDRVMYPVITLLNTIDTEEGES